MLYLQKYTAPSKKQPIRARRSVLAVSIKLVYALITPLSRTARTVVQNQDCRCAAAVLMADNQPKLPISRVAPAHTTKTDLMEVKEESEELSEVKEESEELSEVVEEHHVKPGEKHLSRSKTKQNFLK
ncbi:unnamed protein product [Leuciscus chuanchicus]